MTKESQTYDIEPAEPLSVEAQLQAKVEELQQQLTLKDNQIAKLLRDIQRHEEILNCSTSAQGLARVESVLDKYMYEYTQIRSEAVRAVSTLKHIYETCEIVAGDLDWQSTQRDQIDLLIQKMCKSRIDCLRQSIGWKHERITVYPPDAEF